MSIKSLAHICIKTTDLQKTEDFYCGALGMTKLFNFVWDKAVIGFYMKAANDTFIEVFLSGETGAAPAKRTLDHFCLETNAIQELRQRLVDRGYPAREIIMGADQALQFWVQDPNGLEIEFQEYSGKSSQITGQEVELD
jgi:catechol 2,3-dioxygenase-like lactoylglutathione lyase family enzyme